MTALDVFVFLLLIGGAAIGFVRGFVHEVISLLAWAVGIAMLKLFHSQLWSGLENSFHTSPSAEDVAHAAPPPAAIPSRLKSEGTANFLNLPVRGSMRTTLRSDAAHTFPSAKEYIRSERRRRSGEIPPSIPDSEYPAVPPPLRYE